VNKVKLGPTHYEVTLWSCTSIFSGEFSFLVFRWQLKILIAIRLFESY
jgi:hypothetical protein